MSHGQAPPKNCGFSGEQSGNNPPLAWLNSFNAPPISIRLFRQCARKYRSLATLIPRIAKTARTATTPRTTMSSFLLNPQDLNFDDDNETFMNPKIRSSHQSNQPPLKDSIADSHTRSLTFRPSSHWNVTRAAHICQHKLAGTQLHVT